MPSFDMYKKILGSYTNGEARKAQSAMIMNATWDEDIATSTMYFYDYYHDMNKNQLNNLHPEKDKFKIPIRAKFITNSSQTYSKDPVTYHLMFRPHQQMFVDYYQNYIDNYDAKFPVGLYVDIQDADGVYNKWLVVDKANYNDPQFPTYELLRCDYVLQYMMHGQKVEISVVLQSQNSYNSGIWSDYKITTPEDQQKFAAPLNLVTEKIFYNEGDNNLRMIIDAGISDEFKYRTWKVTKINRIAPNGIVRVTLAQDLFDQTYDYIEKDKNGKVIGKWADFFRTENLPQHPKTPLDNHNYHGEIYYSALPQIKVGGSYKKFTVKFFNHNEEVNFDTIIGNWYFEINGVDASNLVTTIVDENTIKVRFDGSDEYIGSILKIKYTTQDNVSVSVDVKIVGL